MFEYKLLTSYGSNSNLIVGNIYNQYYIVTGVKSEPCFVKDLIAENEANWQIIASKRVYSQLFI